jgi:hypothetical protein
MTTRRRGGLSPSRPQPQSVSAERCEIIMARGSGPDFRNAKAPTRIELVCEALQASA